MLGMLPLARELLKLGSEVVLCANSLPAINDITVQELKDLVQTVSGICPIIKVLTHHLYFTCASMKAKRLLINVPHKCMSFHLYRSPVNLTLITNSYLYL